MLAQIVKGVQFASGARDGDAVLEVLQVVGVDIVIGQLPASWRARNATVVAILFDSFLVSSSTTDNIDSDWANICLTKCRKAVYWTLVNTARGIVPVGRGSGVEGKALLVITSSTLTFSELSDLFDVLRAHGECTRRKSLRRVERELGESRPRHQRGDQRARQHGISAPENERDAGEIDVERELAGELLSGGPSRVRLNEPGERVQQRNRERDPEDQLGLPHRDIRRLAKAALVGGPGVRVVQVADHDQADQHDPDRQPVDAIEPGQEPKSWNRKVGAGDQGRGDDAERDQQPGLRIASQNAHPR